MSVQSPTRPVEDSIPKVNDDLAIGSDLEFQRKWWRFEFAIWTLLTLLTVLALLGFLGRGHFAKARKAAPDGSVEVEYERIARYGTATAMYVTLGSKAIHEGKAQLWVSESLFKQLGGQRIMPPPDQSSLSPGGVLFSFNLSSTPARVELALQPTSVGTSHVEVRVPGFATLDLPSFVMP